MNTGAIIAIIMVIIVSVIIAFVIMISMNTVSHNNYCKNWSANIENQRAQLNIFSDTDAFNNEISQYNQQCAY